MFLGLIIELFELSCKFCYQLVLIPFFILRIISSCLPFMMFAVFSWKEISSYMTLLPDIIYLSLELV
ncbi:hypothetical protein L1887_28456 [Cichorium endivia]|nr:hypothetical protein L1887_28456 [Cichorium endivia]